MILFFLSIFSTIGAALGNIFSVGKSEPDAVVASESSTDILLSDDEDDVLSISAESVTSQNVNAVSDDVEELGSGQHDTSDVAPGHIDMSHDHPADDVPEDVEPEHDASGHDAVHGDTPDHGAMDHTDHGAMDDDTSDHNAMDHTDHGAMDDNTTDHDAMDHSHHAGHQVIEAPRTAAEIDAFVSAVKAAPETHVHDADSSLMGEHMARLDLVPRDEATHIAIGDGDWFDASTWHNGEIPDDDAKVLIPEGITVDYGDESNARLFTVRVDGELDFATDADSKMVVDTFVVSPSGTLTIGTVDNPIQSDVQVDIVIANNGAIDTDWDPELLSRGLISHGEATFHGAVKDSHEKVIDDPMAGDKFVKFAEIPEGWEVGDTIVIAGTRYEGYKWDNDVKAHTYNEPEDEVREISNISGNRVYFREALEFDHDAPRADLHTSVANYSRNVTISTEDADTAEVFERGHVMFMHSDDVDIRYAEFNELGRTDKSGEAQDVSDFNTIEFDTNVKGRYSMHFHRNGAEENDDPAISIGNSVFGSPGWGFVHHDSHAIFDNNASYDTFGAGFVSESGNETGSWTNNIAIDAQGVSWASAKNQTLLDEFDTGRSGDGFWFQSRLIENSDNIAASVNHGFTYFHRGDIEDTAQLQHSSDVTEFPDAFTGRERMNPDDSPILSFKDNEVFASNHGLHVVKANPNQGHDVHSVLEGFTAWEVRVGAHFDYTSHYVIKNFDLIGKEDTQYSKALTGINFGKGVTDMSVVDATIEGFETGVNLHKEFPPNFGLLRDGTFDIEDDSAHEFDIVNPTFIDVVNEYQSYDPKYDTITTGPVNEVPLKLDIDGPLTLDMNDLEIRITGTKTDSLGSQDFPAGTDSVEFGWSSLAAIMEDDGYFQAENGNFYFVLDIYTADRLTGDVYKQSEIVRVEDGEAFKNSWYFRDATFNGETTLAQLDDFASQGATLVRSAEDFFADDTRMDFAPSVLGDKVTWDDKFNWQNNLTPGVNDVADLNGKTVEIETTEIIGGLDLGWGGTLVASTGTLAIQNGIAVGAGGGTFEVDDQGQVLTNGYSDTDTLTLDLAGGAFVNTGDFTGHADIAISDNATVLLGVGEASFNVATGHALNIYGDDAIVGFDTIDGEVSTLSFEAGSTLNLVAQGGGIGSIVETNLGLASSDDVSAQTGVDLGDANLKLNVRGLSEDTEFTLMDVDEIIGSFRNVNVNGLGDTQNANIFVDYDADQVRLEVTQSGTGAVNVETIGSEHNAMQSQVIWAALTNDQETLDEDAHDLVDEDDTNLAALLEDI